MKTLHALGALISYPTRALVEAMPQIRALVVGEGRLDVPQMIALDTLMGHLERTDLYELEEAYVLLFDRSRALSLNIFEHVHGESRDRGQAMVDLKALYAEKGLEPNVELPDFVPVFLEHASRLDEPQARALLAEPAHVFTALAERLRRRESLYAVVFETLVALADATPEPAAFEALVPVEEIAPDDLEALDRVWEEEEVRFGAGAASAECGVDGLVAKIRQAKRPAPGLESKTGPRTVFTHAGASKG